MSNISKDSGSLTKYFPKSNFFLIQNISQNPILFLIQNISQNPFFFNPKYFPKSNLFYTKYFPKSNYFLKNPKYFPKSKIFSKIQTISNSQLCVEKFRVVFIGLLFSRAIKKGVSEKLIWIIYNYIHWHVWCHLPRVLYTTCICVK